MEESQEKKYPIEIKDLYRTLLDTRNLEINLFWQRCNYFLVLNTGVALGFFNATSTSTPSGNRWPGWRGGWGCCKGGLMTCGAICPARCESVSQNRGSSLHAGVPLGVTN